MNITNNLFIGSILLLTIPFIYSCNSVTNERTKNKPIVAVYEYQLRTWDTEKRHLRDSMVLHVDTIYFSNRKWIVHKDSIDNDSTFRFIYSIEKDSLYLTPDMYCENQDTIQIIHNNQTIEFIKSLYDEPNIYDEECYLYWNSICGVIATYNFPWGSLFLYERENDNGLAKETFYNYMMSQSMF